MVGRTDFRTRVLDERYYLLISHLHQYVPQSLRYLQTCDDLESSMYRGATSKKSGGVENCSFRTKRSLFDFGVQNWLWTSYSFLIRESRPSTLPLAWYKILTANVKNCGQPQRMRNTTLAINIRTVFLYTKTINHTINSLIPTGVALPLIWKAICLYINTTRVEPLVTNVTRDHELVVLFRHPTTAIDLHFVVHWWRAR